MSYPTTEEEYIAYRAKLRPILAARRLAAKVRFTEMKAAKQKVKAA